MVAGGAGMGILTVIMVSGGVVLLVLGRHRMPELNLVKPIQSNSSGRSCLSSGKLRKKKQKKVHFAAEVVEPRGEKQENGRVETDSCLLQRSGRVDSAINGHPVQERNVIERAEPNIPANRLALYNGMLRYRLHQASLYR